MGGKGSKFAKPCWEGAAPLVSGPEGFKPNPQSEGNGFWAWLLCLRFEVLPKLCRELECAKLCEELGLLIFGRPIGAENGGSFKFEAAAFKSTGPAKFSALSLITICMERAFSELRSNLVHTSLDGNLYPDAKPSEVISELVKTCYVNHLYVRMWLYRGPQNVIQMRHSRWPWM